MIPVDWATLKEFATSRALSIQWIKSGDTYVLRAADGFFTLGCELRTEEEDIDTADFVANFKAQGNKRVAPADSDGSVIVRNKTTRTGWHYEPRSLDFTTSKVASLYNRKHTGTTIDNGADYEDGTMAFFDAAGIQLVKLAEETDAAHQTRLNENCVRTEVDWQPKYTMDIIGATVSVLNAPTGSQRAYCWIIVAPDVPAALGGQVPFMAGGWNCRHFLNEPTSFLDGRGIKTFVYDPVYNSNKMRVLVKHEVGAQIEMQFVAEHFKA